MTERNRGEAQIHLAAGSLQAERRLPGVLTIGPERDPVTHAGDVGQQLVHFTRAVRIVQRSDDFKWLDNALKIALELSLHCSVQHDFFLFSVFRHGQAGHIESTRSGRFQ